MQVRAAPALPWRLAMKVRTSREGQMERKGCLEEGDARVNGHVSGLGEN